MPMLVKRSVSYLLAFLICVTIQAANFATAVNCPQACRCWWILDSLQVNCANRNLHEYPTFENIPVEQLDLSGNYFVEFPKQYADIDSLIHLDLSNNKIEFIDADTLIGFTSLRTLLLNNNSIISWANINAAEAFSYAPSLMKLSLSGNYLAGFNNDQSNEQLKSKSLKELELDACALTSVGGDQLMNSLPNLERLALNNNPLINIPVLPSKSLRVLEISNCSLQHLSAPLISGLPNLEALHLSRNPALKFGSSINGETILAYNLRFVDLSYCNLDSIDLSGLPTLTNVKLRGNMLRTMNAKIFANNTQIEEVDLSQNSLRVLELDAFSNLKSLTKLNLAYNEIARLDKNLFRNNDVLVALNLSRNVIERFTKIVSNSLREINLSWCEITTIDSRAFSGLSTMQRLDLSHNLISSVPELIHSETLQSLDLSNCRLSTVTNSTFRGFPELANLLLNGNRLTNPIPTAYFSSNKFLDQIWLGDNPWICNCRDPIFMNFYDYLTTKPQKLKDKYNLHCASPSAVYGKSWEVACMDVWMPSERNSKAEGIWTTIMLCLLLIGALFLLYNCVVKLISKQKRRDNRREYESNQDEMQEIRRLNDHLLQQPPSSNAPSVYETNLPSYEDALRMPKLKRPAKSMVDLTEEHRHTRTCPGDDALQQHGDLQLDLGHRFHSEAMLLNRDKERTAQYGPFRRTGRIDHNNSGSRRFSIEEDRFPAAHLKSQNLQSAEQMGNLQSYEHSPYTKRKPKVAEIPPFKRATMLANSIEFLTDPEFDEANSKPSSPFAKRTPKRVCPPATIQVSTAAMAPAIENYFGSGTKLHTSSTGSSDFHIVIEPDIESANDNSLRIVSTSDVERDRDLAKRKKRKNSANRRVSGNFSATVAAAAEQDSSSTSSELESIVLVQKPMRETLF